MPDGKVVLTDAFIQINGVDLSNHANQVQIEDSADEVEVTGFGSQYKEYNQGLKDATITVTFISNFAAASVDATLFPLYDAGTAFPVVIRPFSDPVAVNNPQYTMQSIIYGYSPIAGGVGEAANVDVPFRCADQNGVVKTTA